MKENYKCKRTADHFTSYSHFSEWSSYIPSIHLHLTLHPSSTHGPFRNPVQFKITKTDGSSICCRDLYTLKSEWPGLELQHYKEPPALKQASGKKNKNKNLYNHKKTDVIAKL